jgi:tight adherence protein B
MGPLGFAYDILFLITPLAGSVLIAFGVFQLVRDLRQTDRKKLRDRLKDGSAISSRRAAEQARNSLLRRRTDVSGKGLLAVVSRLHFIPKLQRLLDQANIDWSPARMLVNQVCIAVAGFIALYLFGQRLLAAVAFPVAVFILPLLYLVWRRRRRMAKLVNQLPDVFELLSQALRAGHSLASGIQLVSEQLPDPVGTEFALVFHEQNLGIKVEEALMNLANRVDQLDVRFFVTAVLIQRQTGGDLAEVLDKIGSIIRQRIELFGQVKALTAEGRLSGWVLLALPVLVFFVSLHLNPDYAGMLIHDKDGKLMLYMAIVMQLLGMAMIRKIVNIKV